jgi:non-specific serine/threonine protein kinase
METAHEVATFGDLLQRYRTSAGQSQEELAERAGLSRRGISDLERGIRHTPYPATVRRLVKALGLRHADRAALLAAAGAAVSREGKRNISDCGPGHSPTDHKPTKVAGFLPNPLSSFVGRERERIEVDKLLATTRLLTLTGPGGVGKTRLALRLAESQFAAYSDGAWFVDLASIQDGTLVLETVARVLGAREIAEELLLSTILKLVGHRNLLLILDNCEHVIASCAELVQALLPQCPGLRIITTTRELLGIEGERVWRVPSLQLKDVDIPGEGELVAHSEAAALFFDRARTSQPQLLVDGRAAAVVEEICRRLDGIPLAIELAAARVRHLSIEQVAAHLDDSFRLLTTGSRSAPTRHQTIRATIEWSYQLLSEREQLLFDRLSVFAGGWTLEAAEAVGASDHIDRRDVLELLGRLLDKSLALTEQAGPGELRYRTLETLREFGGERLNRRRHDEVSRTESRHGQFFAELAEQAQPTPGSIRQGWLDVLEREHDNLRAALRRHLAAGEKDEARRLAGALAAFWLVRGHLREGQAWLRAALADPTEGTPTLDTPRLRRIGFDASAERPEATRLAYRAGALHGLGLLIYTLGDYDAARNAYASALELWRRLTDDRGASFSLVGLGMAELYRGNVASARDFLQQAASAATSSRQNSALALSLAFLARAEQDAGDPGTAMDLAGRALAVASESGYARAMCIALVTLGDLYYEDGNHAMAGELLLQARDRGAGDALYASYALAGLGRLAIERGDRLASRDFLVQSLRLSRQIGQVRGMVHALEYTAAFAVAANHSADALHMAAAAEAVRQTKQIPARPLERDRLAPFLQSARTRLGERAADQAWAEGRDVSLDHTVDNALRFLESVETTLERVAPRRPPAPGGESTEARLKATLGLSPREIEVLKLAATGKTSKEIAGELVTSVHTVNNQIASIYAKIGAKRKADAVAFALRSGLI